MMKYSIIAFVLLIQLYQISEDEPSRHLSSSVVVELYHKNFARHWNVIALDTDICSNATLVQDV
jgi:hypothetical protein